MPPVIVALAAAVGEVHADQGEVGSLGTVHRDDAEARGIRGVAAVLVSLRFIESLPVMNRSM
jgi:hypothetical protein